MSPEMIGALGIAILFVLLAVGMPVSFSFIVAGFIGLIILSGLYPALNALGRIPYHWASHYTLMSIPLFVLMGYFAFHSGISQSLYDCAYRWMGHLPGGLAIATTVACAAFGACTGSSLAVSGAMGAIAIPEMERVGYDPKLAVGCVAAGGTLGILIPPSLPFILYGVITETSISKLFISGILPGIAQTGIYSMVVYVLVKLNPKLAPRVPSFPWRERFVSLRSTWMMLALFLLVIGGIYYGVFTPTEAGAIGAFGALVFVIVKKQLTRHNLASSLGDAGRMTAMLFLIFIGAMVFCAFLAITGLPIKLASVIIGLSLPRYGILAAILILYLVLGMIMDAMSMTVLTLPVIFPLIKGLGFDPIWFGVIMVIMTELALITPPVGVNAFIMKGVSGLSLEDVFRSIIPFVIGDIILLALIVAFPQICLSLPNLMKSG